MQKIRVQSLGWDDPLEKEMATHSSILAWKIPWTEEPGRLQSMRSQKSQTDWATTTHRDHELAELNGQDVGLTPPLFHCLGTRLRLPVFLGFPYGCGRPGFNPWVGTIPWRRKQQPTLVLLPGKFHGWRKLVSYSPWGRKHDWETSFRFSMLKKRRKKVISKIW